MKYEYYTPAEFELMTELAGKEDIFRIRRKELPSEGELLTALTVLCRKNRIRREGDGFVIEDPGIFRGIIDADTAVLIQSRRRPGEDAVCYRKKERLTLAELIMDAAGHESYRIGQPDKLLLREWFIDSDRLPEPFLRDEDTAELLILYGDRLKEAKPDLDKTELLLQIWRGGGSPAAEYRLQEESAGRLILREDGAGFYTAEALQRMLTDCFG